MSLMVGFLYAPEANGLQCHVQEDVDAALIPRFLPAHRFWWN